MGTRVLYVDDETELLELALIFFEEANISLEVTDSFQEAIKKAKEKKFDLIISDAKMPEGSGHDLFRKLKSECGFFGKFFLMTGNVQSPDEVANYQGVIYKPVDFSELIRKVRENLG